MEMTGMQVFIADYSFISHLDGSFSHADLAVSFYLTNFSLPTFISYRDDMSESNSCEFCID